jgi:hypothetical protein
MSVVFTQLQVGTTIHLQMTKNTPKINPKTKSRRMKNKKMARVVRTRRKPKP